MLTRGGWVSQWLPLPGQRQGKRKRRRFLPRKCRRSALASCVNSQKLGSIISAGFAGPQVAAASVANHLAPPWILPWLTIGLFRDIYQDSSSPNYAGKMIGKNIINQQQSWQKNIINHQQSFMLNHQVTLAVSHTPNIPGRAGPCRQN